MFKEFFEDIVIRLWNAWEIRVFVSLSLSLQIVLILFSSKRKYRSSNWINILVWSAYLAADWVATLALGKLATCQENSGDNSQKLSQELHAFWAPFLLLHLGGPDTITAYSLEDNELWLRHILGVVVQVGVAIYVFVKSWSNINALTFLSIPMFITGIHKYGERTWVLRSSSKEQFANTVLSTEDPSPSLVKISMRRDVQDEEKNAGSHDLLDAHFLFKRFSHLFVGVTLHYDQAVKCQDIFEKKSVKEAFDLLTIELGFMYDLMYTKAIVVYSRLGIFFRCFHFLSSISTLVVFSIVIHIHTYPLIDICITFFLLVGAIVLEIYALIPHFSSDWTKLICLNKSKNECGAILPFPSLSTNHKKGSISMGQFNLITFCIKDISTITRYINGVQQLLCINKWLEKYQYLTWEDVNDELQEIIYRKVEDSKFLFYRDLRQVSRVINDILAQRGDHVVKDYHLDRDSGGNYDSWFTSECEFGKSVIAWHIFIDLCYQGDFEKHRKDDNLLPRKCKTSRYLSNYMMYLLVFCPSMIPNTAGELRYRDACHELMLRIETTKTKDEFLKRFIAYSSKENAISDPNPDDRVVGIALILFHKFQSLEQGLDAWSCEKKWEMISEVMVEMLAYAANHCGWKEHCQQLTRGGELLTHVRLLMAHHGIATEYESSARTL